MLKSFGRLFVFLSLLASCSKLDNEVAPKTEAVIQVTDTTTAQKTLPEISKIDTNELSVELLDAKPIKFGPEVQTPALAKFCKKIDKEFVRYHWFDSQCDSFKWLHVRNSVLGDPLIWAVFGNEELLTVKPLNVTMIMCGIHGDEITPVKFCFDILHYLYKLEKTPEGQKRLEDNLVVVVPIVTPDSFFKKFPTRTNARGVDVNRNFPTKDWNAFALRRWRNDYKSDKRRYPGKYAMSEPETLFQVNLIKRYSPDKILSVHAPLTILDYDGPTVAHEHLHEIAIHAENLVGQMSKLAKDYTIKNYPFFPGSIGNYAGNERGIPTITLELPTSDNRLHKKYWDQFKSSIDYAIFNSSLKKPELVINHDADPVIIKK